MVEIQIIVQAQCRSGFRMLRIEQADVAILIEVAPVEMRVRPFERTKQEIRLIAQQALVTDPRRIDDLQVQVGRFALQKMNDFRNVRTRS